MESGNFSAILPVLPFEKDFDEPLFHSYMKNKWTDSFAYSALYVAVIFGCRHVMKSRNKFELRGPLALWSGLLAIFSIIGTIRMFPEFLSAVRDHGLHYSVCNPSMYSADSVVAFWATLFTLSKLIEFGDTVFIVLRKQKLIFLHWYHHIATLIYAWQGYSEHAAIGRWFCNMNYAIHALMYSYYCLRAMRYKCPRFVNIIITGLQLLQMIVASSINVYVYRLKSRNEYCQQSYENLAFSSVMYFSYVILFANFFYRTYIAKPVRAKSE